MRSAGLALLLGSYLSSAMAQEAARPPNVLFIMADDLGWMDLACQGRDVLRTPHLDAMAERGMRFTHAYAAAPVCSPTRAAVLTGKSPARLAITNHIPDRDSFVPDHAEWLPAEMLDHLPLEEVTIAERLSEAGYATGFFGKWHLNGKSEKEGRGDPRYIPEKQGFDVNVGGCALGGPPTFFDPYRIHNLPSRKPGEYLPDRLADEVDEFIGAHLDQPFFACLFSYAVHWPMEAPAELIPPYEDRLGSGLNHATYGAMIEALDASIGKILARLDARNLTDQTVVIFTSDNGPYLGVADVRPLRSGKGHLYEGGIRVPLLVQWPGVVAADLTCEVPVISMDFYPTLLEIAGLPQRTGECPDGESLLPLLQSKGGLARDELFFHYPNYAFHRDNRLGGAIRHGGYKLIEYFDGSAPELFDLIRDPGEGANVAESQPGRTADMLERLRRWRKKSGARMPTRRN